MTNPTFVTYHSINAKPSEAWIAYIKPCGCNEHCNHSSWQVRCVGSTEDEAKERALSLWNKERARMALAEPSRDAQELNGWGSYKAATTDHGNAGRVWMRHPTHGLKRVSAVEAVGLGEGWYKSGPRGK